MQLCYRGRRLDFVLLPRERFGFPIAAALPFSPCCSFTLLAGFFTSRTRSRSQYGDRHFGQVSGLSGFAGYQVCPHRLHSSVGSLKLGMAFYIRQCTALAQVVGEMTSGSVPKIGTPGIFL
jgi:hypothetical protein